MAHSVNLTHDRLAWGSTWYLREETLKAAVAALVNSQYCPPLAEHWGGGTLSSSDGQQFPVQGQVGKARALPRHFGCGQGITYYTWSSDQFSQRWPWAAIEGHAPCASSATAPNHPMRAWALT
jgi:TnpA family transposase